MTKPILTRAEVDSMGKYHARTGNPFDSLNRAFNTIEQAVELLRLDCTCELSSYGFHTCDNCKRKQAFLARYEGTNTNGKDGEK